MRFFFYTMTFFLINLVVQSWLHFWGRVRWVKDEPSTIQTIGSIVEVWRDGSTSIYFDVGHYDSERWRRKKRLVRHTFAIGPTFIHTTSHEAKTAAKALRAGIIASVGPFLEGYSVVPLNAIMEVGEVEETYGSVHLTLHLTCQETVPLPFHVMLEHVSEEDAELMRKEGRYKNTAEARNAAEAEKARIEAMLAKQA